MAPSFGPLPDPHKTRNASEILVWQWVASFLYRFSPHDPFHVEPDLALTMPEIPSDGTLLTVKLNPAAKWQPREPANGRPVDSDDIRATFERIKALGARSPRAGNYTNIEKITAVDAQTIQFKLKSPQADILAIMADQYDLILPREIAARGDDAIKATTDIFGTGAYALTAYEAGRKVTLARRSDGPWRPNTAWLYGLELLAVTDENAKANALLNGQADIADLPAVLARVFRARDDFQVLEVPQPARECLLINCANPRWKDQRLRLALQRAVDRRALYAAVFESAGVVSGPVSPAARAWALTDGELAGQPGFGDRDAELTEAKRLLSAAGVPDGLEETILTTTANRLDLVTNELAGQLSSIGIRLKPLPQGDDINVLTDRVRKGDFTLATMNFLSGIYPDAQIYVYEHSAGSANYGKYVNKDLDVKLDRQRGIYDTAARTALVKEIQRDLLAAPGPVWLGTRLQETIASKRIHGLSATPFISGYDEAEAAWSAS